MKSILKYSLAAAFGCTMLTSAALAQSTDTQIPLTGEKVEGAPFEVKRDWGTFKLADRIAAKVKAGEPINYVFSYQASGIPLFSPQYAAGAKMGCEMAQGIYTMNCTAIAPVQNDANQQVAQIEAKLAAGEIDCIGIEPVDFEFADRDHQQADGPRAFRCSPPACLRTATSSPASPRSR